MPQDPQSAIISIPLGFPHSFSQAENGRAAHLCHISIPLGFPHSFSLSTTCSHQANTTLFQFLSDSPTHLAKGTALSQVLEDPISIPLGFPHSFSQRLSPRL